MGDNRMGHGTRSQPLDTEPNNRFDYYLRSESPRVQQIILHQKLKEEIEKDSIGRVRYVDSELYLRNNQRSPALVAPEMQSTTLDVGIDHPGNSREAPIKPSSKTPANSAPIAKKETDMLNEGKSDPVSRQDQTQQLAIINRNCQVCLIREIRQDLMNINKIVQERNEQISKLKSKCLRSYFERQMMD